MENYEYKDIRAHFKSIEFLDIYDSYTDNNISYNNIKYDIYNYLVANGYDPRKTTTIIFSYLIKEAYNKLDLPDIEEQITSPFSQFYLDFECLNMGPKSIHSNILAREYTGKIEDLLAVQTYGMEALNIARSIKEDRNILIKKVQ